METDIGAKTVKRLLELLIVVNCFGLDSSAQEVSQGWQMVAYADVIAHGTLRIPFSSRSKIVLSDPFFVPIQLSAASYAKGGDLVEWRTNLAIAVRAGRWNYGPLTPKTVFRFSRKKVIILGEVPRFDQRHGWVSRFESDQQIYFPHNILALEKFSSGTWDKIEAEVKQERTIHENFGRFKIAHQDAYDEKVKSTINKLLSSGPPASRLQELVSLGPEAIPAMVRQIGDGRAIPDPRLEWPTRKGWEGIWHGSVDNISLGLQFAVRELDASAPRFRALPVEDMLRIWEVYLVYRAHEKEPLF